jgi:pSer/pThr/pTyr-binding forkhead associated (FHA) protein
MILFQLLSGRKAGSRALARRFPFSIGRASQNDLPLDDDGIWDRHLTVEFKATDGFYLATATNAIAAVNGKPVVETILRNGDVITVGSAKIQFWLAPALQYGLALRENCVWALLLLVTLAQIFLICFCLG